MDMNLHGAGFPRLVGPAGFSGGAGGGPGFSTQFRILPSPLPSECVPVDSDVVAVISHIHPQKLRCGAPNTHRPLASTEPLQSAGGSPHSPSQEKEYSFFKSNSLLLHEAKKVPALLGHSLSMPSRLDAKAAAAAAAPVAMELDATLVVGALE